jgi:hypothetical protein
MELQFVTSELLSLDVIKLMFLPLHIKAISALAKGSTHHHQLIVYSFTHPIFTFA